MHGDRSYRGPKAAFYDSRAHWKQPQYSYVHVERRHDVNLRRIKLPVCMMEQEIIEAVRSNDVIMITGDTGCGKSTQVPQFLYENGFCLDGTIIGVTQVRRVACLALYNQVALELNSKTLVGYQFRFNKGYNHQLCKIKFMTDGILLQELKQDLLCSKYSVLIIDEAHERNLNCDLLIGILSGVVRARRDAYNSGESTLPPLKVIIMSATIRAEEFLAAEIFKGGIAHRHISTQFKRNIIHFSRRSVTDYVMDAQEKILKIHRRLPPGSILVFLTGKDELWRLQHLLKPHERALYMTDASAKRNEEELDDNDKLFNIDSDDGYESSKSDDDDGVNTKRRLSLDDIARKERKVDDEVDVETQRNLDNPYNASDDKSVSSISSTSSCDRSDFSPMRSRRHSTDCDSRSASQPSSYSHQGRPNENGANKAEVTGGLLLVGEENLESYHEDEPYKVELEVLSKSYKRVSQIKWQGAGAGQGALRVVVMHASQTMKTQMAAFAPPEDNERVVILSTNVAETAITLPNIRYVIDCGKEKRRMDDIAKGVSRFVVCDISKASADQRAGRAGRVGTGHCYRQYTSSVYETLFDDYSPVEIENCNMESTILMLSSIGIESPYDFPFLTRPPEQNIKSAIEALAIMGAIEIPQLIANDKMGVHNEIGKNPFKIPPQYPYKTQFDSIVGLKVAKITKLGEYLALLPIQPRYAKMLYCVLSKGANEETVKLACCIVSALAVGVNNILYQSAKYEDSEIRNLPKLGSDFELFIWICCRFSQANRDGGTQFCRQYGINLKMLREVFQQARQLHFNLCGSLAMGKPQESDWTVPLATPNHSTARIIEDAIVECMVDKVAVLAKHIPGSTSQNPWAYLTGSLVSSRKEIYLSKMYAKQKPECVVYGSLVEGTRVKMQDISLTDGSTLCTVKSPLIISDTMQTTPVPYYDIKKDCVMAYSSRLYAPLEYSLGIAKTALNPDHPMATRIFAQQLCFGHIFKALGPFVSSLTVLPAEFILSVQQKSPLGKLLIALRRYKVSSRQSFMAHHKKNQDFLLAEYMDLLNPESYELRDLKVVYRNLAIG